MVAGHDGERRRRASGFIAKRPETRAAAFLTSFGLDGMRLFSTADQTEALALAAVAKQAQEIATQRDKALAVEIANAVGQLFRK